MLVRSRFDDMVRELKHLRSREHQDYRVARKRGWTTEALEAVLAFNSFYQVVLAPLASSGRNYRDRDLGSATPIIYGKSMRFDRSWCETVMATDDSFQNIIAELGIQIGYLTAQHTSDVLFRLSRDLQKDEL
jgi:hypothetical protein